MTNAKQRAIISRSSRHDLDVLFYRRFDPDLLFNKALALDYATKNADHFRGELEEQYPEFGEPIDDHYFASLRAELHFIELHQFETFFAVLIARFQDEPHWVYLTRYRTKDIKTAINWFVDGDIRALTGGQCDNAQDFFAQALYSNGGPVEAELRGKWDGNLAMVAWLVRRMAQRYLEGDEYNAYKHGLRLMTGPHGVEISAQGDDGVLSTPIWGVSTDNSITYLEMKDAGEGGETLYEVTKHFNPAESFAYLTLMHQMLQTTVRIRRALLSEEQGTFEVKEFASINKEQIYALGADNRTFTITV